MRLGLRVGFSIEAIFNLMKIARWFLMHIKEIVEFEEELAGNMDAPKSYYEHA